MDNRRANPRFINPGLPATSAWMRLAGREAGLLERQDPTRPRLSKIFYRAAEKGVTLDKCLGRGRVKPTPASIGLQA